MTTPALRVHRLHPTAPLPRPASSRRDWMDRTRNRFAYRCLPLAMGNSIGWDLIAPVGFDAVWLGEEHEASVQVRAHGPAADASHPLLPAGHFGHGILTLQTGLLVRTPEPFGLWVLPPLNTPRDGVAPLGGFVETSWLAYPFTLNWQCLEPGRVVRVRAGEPIATIVPLALAHLEATEIEVSPVEADAPFADRLAAWRSARDAQHAEAAELPPGTDHGWSRTYLRGRDPGGPRPDGSAHRTRLALAALPEAGEATVAAPAPRAYRTSDWHWGSGTAVTAFEPDGAVRVRAGIGAPEIRLTPALYELLMVCRSGEAEAWLTGPQATGVRACLERLLELGLVAGPVDGRATDVRERTPVSVPGQACGRFGAATR